MNPLRLQSPGAAPRQRGLGRKGASVLVLAGILALGVAVPLNIQAARTQNTKPEGGLVDPQARVIPTNGSAGLLCMGAHAGTPSASRGIHVIHSGDLAVAADSEGHFTMYAHPKPGTGLPSADSFEMLRDCLPELSFANLASARTDAGRVILGADTAKGRTRIAAKPDGSRSLVTDHQLPSGLTATQTLTIVEDPARPSSLRLRHTITNEGDAAASVDFRQILDPALSTDRDVPFEVPGLAGRPDGPMVRNETTLLKSAGEIPQSFLVPRPAAASDSSARWRRGPGPSPTHITFAGWHELAQAPMLHTVRLAWPLPKTSAVAVLWKDLALKPGQSRTLTQSYGLQNTPQPTLNDAKAGS